MAEKGQFSLFHKAGSREKSSGGDRGIVKLPEIARTGQEMQLKKNVKTEML